MDEALVDKDFVIGDLQFMGAGVAHNEFAIEMEQITVSISTTLRSGCASMKRSKST